eukprot:106374-Amphidinium_carterae.1
MAAHVGKDGAGWPSETSSTTGREDGGGQLAQQALPLARRCEKMRARRMRRHANALFDIYTKERGNSDSAAAQQTPKTSPSKEEPSGSDVQPDTCTAGSSQQVLQAQHAPPGSQPPKLVSDIIPQAASSPDPSSLQSAAADERCTEQLRLNTWLSL